METLIFYAENPDKWRRLHSESGNEEAKVGGGYREHQAVDPVEDPAMAWNQIAEVLGANHPLQK